MCILIYCTLIQWHKIRYMYSLRYKKCQFTQKGILVVLKVQLCNIKKKEIKTKHLLLLVTSYFMSYCSWSSSVNHFYRQIFFHCTFASSPVNIINTSWCTCRLGKIILTNYMVNIFGSKCMFCNAHFSLSGQISIDKSCTLFLIHISYFMLFLNECVKRSVIKGAVGQYIYWQYM